MQTKKEVMVMYLPMKYAENMTRHGILELFTTLGVADRIPEFNNQDILDYTNDETFLTPSYRGKFRPFNEYMLQAPTVKKVFGDDDVQKEMRDVLSMTAIVSLWSKAKTVYKFDRDFAVDLSKTNGLRIYPSVLAHLPYNTFYIDTTNIPEFAPFTGIFVHVEILEDESIIVWAHRTIEDRYYTNYSYLNECIRQYDNGVAFYDCERTDLRPPEDVIHMSHFIQNHEGDFVVDNRASTDIWMFVYQALTYLASDKPEVYISPETKAAKQKARQAGKKLNDAVKLEVGYRYGAAVRKEREQRAKVIYEGGGSGTHKSPRPHARAAHWHHYWVGEGRTTLIVKWLPQTFVGAGDEKQAVIRKVHGSSKKKK